MGGDLRRFFFEDLVSRTILLNGIIMNWRGRASGREELGDGD